MSSDPQDAPTAKSPIVATEASTWWDQNQDAVEAKFIGLLLAGTNRAPSSGPERRPLATVALDPADVALAQTQARGLGIPYEEYARHLFHQAVMAEEERYIL